MLRFFVLTCRALAHIIIRVSFYKCLPITASITGGVILKRFLCAFTAFVIMLTVCFGAAAMQGCDSAGEASASGSSAGYPIVINEVMSSNSIYAVAGDGGYYDWVELHNTSDTAIDLTGCHLADDEGDPLRYEINGLTVQPYGYAVIYLSGLDKVDEAGYLHANFKLSSRGETLLLSDPDGYIVSRITIMASEENISFGIDEAGGTGAEMWFSEPTPGARNSASASTNVSGLTYSNNGVVINEYCPNNTFTIYDEDGDYSDWVELYNPTDMPADMGGYTLTDNKDNPSKWVIPDGVTVPAGGYLVVFCSGKDRDTVDSVLHTNFALGSEDTYLGLYTNQGKLSDDLELLDLAQNVSCGYLTNERTLKLFSCPTPGRANSTSSYELTANVTANLNNGVLISETLAVSTDSKTYNRDYIEIYNSTSEAVLLSGYSIAKDLGE
ncbi:MAG: lamin tail domain-containing protein, partial [Ruminococcaceae bacterium]|nr:lamin tail domain-containing protein [Oscillospiraceae bacterium]